MGDIVYLNKDEEIVKKEAIKHLEDIDWGEIISQHCYDVTDDHYVVAHYLLWNAQNIIESVSDWMLEGLKGEGIEWKKRTMN